MHLFTYSTNEKAIARYRTCGFRHQIEINNYSSKIFGVMVENSAVGAGGLGLIPRPVKSDTVSPTARHRSHVSSELCCPALSAGDGPRYSLHASARCREYNEDLILGSNAPTWIIFELSLSPN